MTLVNPRKKRYRESNVTNEERKEQAKIKKHRFNGFDDTPYDWGHYLGSGKAQEEFFKNNSNNEEILDEIYSNYHDQSQFNSVWVPGDFMHGEGYKDWDDMADWAKEAIKVYDKYLDRTVLNKGLVVNRLATAELILGKGNKFPSSLEQLQALRGKVVVSLGNLSTGVAKEGLTIGSPLTTNPKISWEKSSAKSIEYKIKIPKGSKGAGLWIGDGRVNSHFNNEQREFMMNRDIRLRVGRTKYDSKRDVYVVEMTYVGRIPHRYK